jgi:hypothetical protein
MRRLSSRMRPRSGASFSLAAPDAATSPRASWRWPRRLRSLSRRQRRSAGRRAARGTKLRKLFPQLSAKSSFSKPAPLFASRLTTSGANHTWRCPLASSSGSTATVPRGSVAAMASKAAWLLDHAAPRLKGRTLAPVLPVTKSDQALISGLLRSSIEVRCRPATPRCRWCQSNSSGRL